MYPVIKRNLSNKRPLRNPEISTRAWLGHSRNSQRSVTNSMALQMLTGVQQDPYMGFYGHTAKHSAAEKQSNKEVTTSGPLLVLKVH